MNKHLAAACLLLPLAGGCEAIQQLKQAGSVDLQSDKDNRERAGETAASHIERHPDDASRTNDWLTSWDKKIAAKEAEQK